MVDIQQAVAQYAAAELRPISLASPTLPLPPPRDPTPGELIERRVPLEAETLVSYLSPQGF